MLPDYFGGSDVAIWRPVVQGPQAGQYGKAKKQGQEPDDLDVKRELGL